MNYSTIEMLCIFFVYGFFGWCAEVIYAAVNQGKFVNRGFLLGPICPIYGIGMLAVILALEPLKENLIILYLGSVAITSAIELVVGALSEKLLHERLWDYSNDPFNLHGYICLKFSLMWGVGAMMIVCLIHPLIMKGIAIVPEWLAITLVCLFGGIMIADCILTLMEAAKIPRRVKALREMERLLIDFSVGIGGNLTDGALKMRDGQEQFEKKREVMLEKIAAYKQTMEERGTDIASRRLRNAFPNLDKSRYAERLERVKRLYAEYIETKSKDRK